MVVLATQWHFRGRKRLPTRVVYARSSTTSSTSCQPFMTLLALRRQHMSMASSRCHCTAHQWHTHLIPQTHQAPTPVNILRSSATGQSTQTVGWLRASMDACRGSDCRVLSLMGHKKCGSCTTLQTTSRKQLTWLPHIQRSSPNCRHFFINMQSITAFIHCAIQAHRAMEISLCLIHSMA